MSEEPEEGEREEYCSRTPAISLVSAGGKGGGEKRTRFRTHGPVGCHDHPSRVSDVLLFRPRARAINVNTGARLTQTVPDSSSDWFAWRSRG